jgi:FkbM family methyltransferase
VGATILQLLGGHKVQELVVAPVPAWFTPHLPQLLQAAERLALVDNFKAGQVLEQITVITLDEYHTRFGREAQALLIPTRDPRLEQVFREAFDSPLAVSTNRLHEHRLTALRDRYGDLPIYEASGLENVLAQVFQDNDLSKVVQFAYRHLTPGSVVFDVGAHAGHTALLFRQRCAKVYGFEPDPIPFETMAARFHGEPSVVPVRAALGRRAGKATLSLDYRGATGCSSSLLVDLFTEPLRVNAERTTVDVLALDAFCETEGVIPDFIKIDVEGSEPDVVEGGWEVLKRRRPPLVYEQYSYFAQLRPDDYLNMMDRLATRYHLECQETGEDPRRRFMTPVMPPLTNVACHPRAT